MENDKFYLDLVTQSPINYNGLIFYQPTFNEIRKYGIDYYNKIMQIYSLTPECFEIPINNLFEDIFILDKSFLYCLSESLYFLTKANSISLDLDKKAIILNFIENKEGHDKDSVQCDNSILDTSDLQIQNNDKVQISEKIFVIDSSNFDEISDLILKINSSKKIKIEKPPENMSERQRDIWNKLQEGRNRSNKKEEVHIYDILNVCEYCGNYIPIEEIMKWSLWRIMNCYKAKIGIKSYNDNLQIALVSGDSKSISGNNHWHQQLMIRE